MSSYISYFTPASWKQAQKNKSELEATNPTSPVLNEEDEQFLERITSQEGPAPPLPARPSVIKDDGEEEEVRDAEVKEAGEMVLPASSPAVEEYQEQKGKAMTELKLDGGVIGEVDENNGDEEQEQAQCDNAKASQPNTEKQAEGEQTHNEHEDRIDVEPDGPSNDDKMSKSWTSYLPTIPTLSKKKAGDKPEGQEMKDQVQTDEVNPIPSSPKSKKNKKDHFPTQEEAEAATAVGTRPPLVEDPAAKFTGRQTENVSNQKSWASLIPNMAALSRSTPQEQAGATLASAASSVKKGKEAEEKAATQSEDEKEVSVLLDRLNLSAINNRVFSFSQESQKVYQSFTVVLKDIIAGGPTAYEDLEKLIEENKEQLEKMFSNMPPFVQTLVKSLPAKVGSALGPEVLAAMSEKPGADMQARMAASSSSSEAAGLNVPSGASKKKQKKSKIPSARSLVSEKGAVASMLRNILNFLKMRFPAFVTGTNVLMSLAVFILLLVFWYCHKRGKEVRLLAEKERASANVSEADDSDVDEGTVIDEKVDHEQAAEPTEKETEGDLTAASVKEDEDYLHGMDKPEVKVSEADTNEAPSLIPDDTALPEKTEI